MTSVTLPKNLKNMILDELTRLRDEARKANDSTNISRNMVILFSIQFGAITLKKATFQDILDYDACARRGLQFRNHTKPTS